jgi:hypothetical protein
VNELKAAAHGATTPRSLNDVIERRRELGLDAFIDVAAHREAKTGDRAQTPLPYHQVVAPFGARPSISKRSLAHRSRTAICSVPGDDDLTVS